MESSGSGESGDETKEIPSAKRKPDDSIVEYDTDEDEKSKDVGKLPSTTDDKKIYDYSKHVTYNESGVAIYKDPATNVTYQWNKIKNEWELEVSSIVGSTPEAAASAAASVDPSNPYENEHYIWDSAKNEWVSKETEFYRWSSEKKEWIPKVTNQSNDGTEIVYGFDEKLQKHTYTDKDGVEFFWDDEKNAWFPKIDDDFMARYQMSYGFIDAETQAERSKKSAQTEYDDKLIRSLNANDDEDEKSDDDSSDSAASEKRVKLKRKLPAEPPKWFELQPEANTKVYVSNLPRDITEDEFVELMSKCGMIVRDVETRKMKVKLYREANGELKGDGLCDYIKVESVELALNLLDGSDLRGQKISVQRAKFEMRGEYNPTLKPKKKKKTAEKQKKLQEKLFDWRPDRMRGERPAHERTVVIKNLFTRELFEREVQLIIDYKNDLREECKKCGTVRKVVLYDRHSEGVAQVTMGDPEEADIVVKLMDGRYFGQRKLSASLWDGKTLYKIDESEGENKERLENWSKFLESDDGEPKVKEPDSLPEVAARTDN